MSTNSIEKVLWRLIGLSNKVLLSNHLQLFIVATDVSSRIQIIQSNLILKTNFKSRRMVFYDTFSSLWSTIFGIYAMTYWYFKYLFAELHTSQECIQSKSCCRAYMYLFHVYEYIHVRSNRNISTGMIIESVD